MNKKMNSLFAFAGTAAIIASAVAMSASAQSLNASLSAGGINVGVGANASTSLKVQLITKAQDRADKEIARRITALNALSARINDMQKLSADEKSSLSASLQSQIALMNNLQAQIATDVAAQSTSSLKTDIKSITDNYRIFRLVLPQGAIEAASDRVLTTASTMTDLGTKLQARIAAASSSANVSAAQTAFADFNAKVADANAQATAANSEVASLQPDNGDQTVFASNEAALKDARTKIQASQQDIVAARNDALTIIKDLKINAGAEASASGNASTSSQ